jgi:hypothetical protein
MMHHAEYAPAPSESTGIVFECPHEAELHEYQRLMEFASYNRACLCLCMTSYKDVPEPSDSAAYRDSVTCIGLNILGHFTTTLNLSHSEAVNPGVHCYANLNNLDRLKGSMKAAWKPYYPPNNDIFLDNCRMPVRIYISIIICFIYNLFYQFDYSIEWLCWIGFNRWILQ